MAFADTGSHESDIKIQAVFAARRIISYLRGIIRKERELSMESIRDIENSGGFEESLEQAAAVRNNN